MKRRVMNGSWELRAGGWGRRRAAAELPSCDFGKGTRLQNKSDGPCAAPGPLVCRGAKAGAGHLPGAGSRLGAGAPGSGCAEGRAGARTLVLPRRGQGWGMGLGRGKGKPASGGTWSAAYRPPEGGTVGPLAHRTVGHRTGDPVHGCPCNDCSRRLGVVPRAKQLH